jgi:membrane-bound metal-dependent hydrolase YbcI (DUF457 family)
MRALIADRGFTISILAVVIVTTVFAVVAGATLTLVVAMLVLGLFTAVVEHILHSRTCHNNADRSRQSK